MSEKEVINVRCKGRLPETKKPCNQIVYQSDGEFLLIAGKVVNPQMREQWIVCECGYRTRWERRREFRKTNVDKNTFVDGRDLIIFERKK